MKLRFIRITASPGRPSNVATYRARRASVSALLAPNTSARSAASQAPTILPSRIRTCAKPTSARLSPRSSTAALGWLHAASHERPQRHQPNRRPADWSRPIPRRSTVEKSVDPPPAPPDSVRDGAISQAELMGARRKPRQVCSDDRRPSLFSTSATGRASSSTFCYWMEFLRVTALL
jgi:hypothetical protein